MKGALAIFRFLADAAKRGERTVLVTLTEVIGSSSRAPGTHMAVSEIGASIGSFSGGCVEAAVVAEAQAILARGKAELVRFGAGSRYIDIRLPCGGGIDLLFTPEPSLTAVSAAAELLEARETASLGLGLDGTLTCGVDISPGWHRQSFSVTHEPDLRVVIVGHGAEPLALARLATSYSAGVLVLSPDAALLEEVRALGIEGERLLTPASTSGLVADAHTAIVFLFHDHDWETELMIRALESPAFFIGAMGSRSTHQRRRELLADRGVPPQEIARVVGPIGIIPATRDPETLGLSILAQIVGLRGQGHHGGRADHSRMSTASRAGSIGSMTPQAAIHELPA